MKSVKELGVLSVTLPKFPGGCAPWTPFGGSALRAELLGSALRASLINSEHRRPFSAELAATLHYTVSLALALARDAV